jgi:hypothetical protein
MGAEEDWVRVEHKLKTRRYRRVTHELATFHHGVLCFSLTGVLASEQDPTRVTLSLSPRAKARA